MVLLSFSNKLYDNFGRVGSGWGVITPNRTPSSAGNGLTDIGQGSKLNPNLSEKSKEIENEPKFALKPKYEFGFVRATPKPEFEAQVYRIRRVCAYNSGLRVARTKPLL